jgi:DNA-directed RNA polymerase specialized sigma24 family protein
MTDEQLIKECLSGRPSAQKALYERFSRKMMGVCLRYSGSYEEARDVLQDGFIKVLRNLDRIPEVVLWRVGCEG